MLSFQGRRLLLPLATVAAVLVGCAEKGTAVNSGEQGSVGGSPAAAVTRATNGGQTSTITSNGATGGVVTTVGGAPSVGGTSGASGSVGVSGSSAASLPDYLPGLWILGWSGGLDHYSWVRFSPYDATQGGRIDLLDSPDSGAWDPFFACEGMGRWYLTARPQTVELWLPTLCGQDAKFTFTVESVGPASPVGIFAKASQQASLQTTSSTSTGGNPITAFKYPDSQCDAAMTTCKAPE